MCAGLRVQTGILSGATEYAAAQSALGAEQARGKPSGTGIAPQASSCGAIFYATICIKFVPTQYRTAETMSPEQRRRYVSVFYYIFITKNAIKVYKHLLQWSHQDQEKKEFRS